MRLEMQKLRLIYGIYLKYKRGGDFWEKNILTFEKVFVHSNSLSKSNIERKKEKYKKGKRSNMKNEKQK